jgi:hypothetical protein
MVTRAHQRADLSLCQTTFNGDIPRFLEYGDAADDPESSSEANGFRREVEGAEREA